MSVGGEEVSSGPSSPSWMEPLMLFYFLTRLVGESAVSIVPPPGFTALLLTSCKEVGPLLSGVMVSMWFYVWGQTSLHTWNALSTGDSMRQFIICLLPLKCQLHQGRTFFLHSQPLKFEWITSLASILTHWSQPSFLLAWLPTFLQSNLCPSDSCSVAVTHLWGSVSLLGISSERSSRGHPRGWE